MPSASQAVPPKTGLVIDRGSHTIRLTRDFDAPRAHVFAAWTQPEHMVCWWDAAGERHYSYEFHSVSLQCDDN